MADGKVVIDVILDDKQVSGGIKKVEGRLNGISGAAKSGIATVGKLVGALGLVGLAYKGIDMVKQSLDGAIDRYDTLNNFPRVMQQIGFDSEESQRAIDKLSDGIQGLPTRLDEVASTAQSIAIMTGDLDGAVDTTLALNNAFLASGASTEDAERGLRQYVQMLSKGKVDIDSWYTLQETMPFALRETAEAFGFTGKSATNDFYEALKSGDITMSEFNDKLIELDQAQGGFAETAQTASGGIKTAWTNMKTWVVMGVTNIIASLDEALGGVGSIEEGINKLKPIFHGVFGWIADVAIPLAVEAIKIMVGVITELITKAQEVWQALQPWLPVIAAIGAGVGTFLLLANSMTIVATVIAKALSIFNIFRTAIMAARLAMVAFNTAILANPIALLVAAIVSAAVLIYVYWEPIAEFFLNLWETIKEAGLLIWGSLEEGWQNAKENLTESWDSVKEFFSDLWSSIGEIFATSYDWINELTGGFFGEYVEIIQAYLMTAWGIIVAIWDFIKDTFNNALEFISALVDGDFEGMKNAMKKQMESARKLLSEIWGAIKEHIGSKLLEILNNVKEKFTEVKTNIQNKITEAKNALVNKFSEMVSGARNKATEIVSAVRNKFTEVVTAIKDKMVEAVRTLAQKIGEMPGKVIEKAEDMVSAGKDLIKGLIKGIKNMGKDAIEAITGVVGSVVDKAKSMLGISSPSKLFKQFGEWTSEGLSIGIDDESKNVIKSVSSMIDDMSKEVDVGLLGDLKGLTPELAIGANMAVNARGVTTNSAELSSNTRRYSTVINILTEQNRILSQLLRKDQDLYIDGEKVTDIVNANNAIMATISKF